MKNYGIDMKGAIVVEFVDTYSTFSSPDDVGRMIYVEDRDAIYIGTDTDWKRIDSTRQHDSSDVAPVDPEIGMLYYNSANHTMYVRNVGGSWTAMFTSTHPPLDRRDGGTFSAAYIGGSTWAQLCALLAVNGNYIELKNLSGATLGSGIYPNYVATSSGSDTLLCNGSYYHHTSFAKASDPTIQISIMGGPSGSMMRLHNLSEPISVLGYAVVVPL